MQPGGPSRAVRGAVEPLSTPAASAGAADSHASQPAALELAADNARVEPCVDTLAPASPAHGAAQSWRMVRHSSLSELEGVISSHESAHQPPAVAAIVDEARLAKNKERRDGLRAREAEAIRRRNDALLAQAKDSSWRSNQSKHEDVDAGALALTELASAGGALSLALRDRLGEGLLALSRAVRPDKRQRKVWDALLLLLVAFNCYASPLFLIFYTDAAVAADDAVAVSAAGSHRPPLLPVRLRALVVMSDVVALLDVVLCLFTPYANLGFWHEEPLLIAERYFRQWFWPDLLTSLPYDALFGGAGAGRATGGSAMLGFRAALALGVLRIGRLLRAVKHVWLRHATLAPTTGAHYIQRILGFLCLWILFAHWVAVLFWALGRYELERHSTGWIAEAGLTTEPAWPLYVSSLHYCFATMTPMGYADVRAVTWREKLLSVSMQLSGAVLYGTVLVVPPPPRLCPPPPKSAVSTHARAEARVLLLPQPSTQAAGAHAQQLLCAISWPRASRAAVRATSMWRSAEPTPLRPHRRSIPAAPPFAAPAFAAP